MKPRKQRLIIERTAYSDSYLGLRPDNTDEWQVRTKGPTDMRVTLRSRAEVLLHVEIFMKMQLEAENEPRQGAQDIPPARE